MADRRGQEREMVYCHACQNEWFRDEHGLGCPQCQSDIVEIVDANNDLRDTHFDPFPRGDESLSLTRSPLHDHDPWNYDVPDPEEGDIDHLAFMPAPGVRIERTLIRSSSSSPREPRRPNNNDLMGPILQSIIPILGGAAGSQGGPQGRPGQGRYTPMTSTTHLGPQNPFPPPGHHNVMHQSGLGSDNHGAGRSSFTTTRVFPRNAPTAEQNNHPLPNFHAIMTTLFQSIQDSAVPDSPSREREGEAPGAGGNPFNLLAQLLGNPAEAVHGDAVYTQEAFDRIIGQMMEQNSAGHAPGPASAQAIEALPKKAADKDMMGSDGKAECSVCMDTVNIGDEVTVLPCKHWFHGECVGAWLKEHDTCPHCRQGIMPSNAPEANAPRSPAPTVQNPFTASFSPPASANRRRNTNASQQSMPGAFTQPGMQHPYVPGGYPTYPEPRQWVPHRPHSPHLPPLSQTQSRNTGGFPFHSAPSSPTSPGISPSQQNVNHLLSMRGAQRRPESSSRRNSRHSLHSPSGSREGGGSGGGGGGGVTGWFRNLRGGNRGGD